MTRASTKAAEARRANASLRSSAKDCPPEMRSPSRRSPGKRSFAVERTPSPTRLSPKPAANHVGSPKRLSPKPAIHVGSPKRLSPKPAPIRVGSPMRGGGGARPWTAPAAGTQGRVPDWRSSSQLTILSGGRGGVPALGPTGRDIIIDRTMDAERTRLKKTLRGRSTSAVGGEILQWGVHSVSFSLSSKLEHSEAAAGVIIGVCASDLDPTKVLSVFDGEDGWGFEMSTGAFVREGEATGEAAPRAPQPGDQLNVVLSIGGADGDTLALYIDDELQSRTVICSHMASRGRAKLKPGEGYSWAVALADPGQAVRVHLTGDPDFSGVRPVTSPH